MISTSSLVDRSRFLSWWFGFASDNFYVEVYVGIISEKLSADRFEKRKGEGEERNFDPSTVSHRDKLCIDGYVHNKNNTPIFTMIITKDI